MANSNIETKVEKLLEPIIQNLEYELYDVQYIKEGKDYYLRITIDRPTGIGIQDCEIVNHAIDKVLDEADLIHTSYFLEVSSPGLERLLRKDWHFEKQIGNNIQVKLYQAIEGQKEVQGKLIEYRPNELCLETKKETIKIENKNIAVAKTAQEF